MKLKVKKGPSITLNSSYYGRLQSLENSPMLLGSSLSIELLGKKAENNINNLIRASS